MRLSECTVIVLCACKCTFCLTSVVQYFYLVVVDFREVDCFIGHIR